MAVYPGGGGGKKKKKYPVGSRRNPLPGGTGRIPAPGMWKRGNQGAATFYGRGLFGGGIPAAAPAPGGGGYSGIVSDYLNQARADFAAESAADAASRDAAIRRYIISYGEVPDFAALGIDAQTLGFLQGALDPKTRELAEKNTKEGTSIKARMAHENMLQQRRIPAGLAARGMLRSGQTGSDLSEQARQFKIQGFDTLNEMLGGISGTVGNFLSAERERQRALAQAAMDAAMQANSDWGDSYFDSPSSPGYNGQTLASTRFKPSAATTFRPTVRTPRSFYPQLRRLGRYGGIRRTPNNLGGFSAY